MVRARTGGRLAKSVGFAAAPAVVGAGDALVDLLPDILAHVVDVDRPRAGLDREGERIAQAEVVDELVDAGGRPHERVVGRDEMPDRCVVSCRDAAIESGYVDAELLAQEVGKGLGDPVGASPWLKVCVLSPTPA